MNSILEPQPPAVSPPVTPVPPPVAPQPAPDWFAWACPCCHATLRTVTTARRGTCPACGSMIEAPEPPTPVSPAPSPAAPRSRFAAWARRHGWRVLAVGSLALAVGTGSLLWVRSQPWTRILAGLGSGPADRPPTPEALRESLHRFLLAPGWTAKRAHVLDASRLDRLGAAYYQGRDPDEIKAGDFQPSAMPGLDRLAGVAVLRAERPGRRPVLAVFRKTDTGWLLDWELFTQTYDEALPSFLASPAFPLRTFRARLARVFPESAPEGVCAVQVSDPLDPGQRITVHLPTGTPIMNSVAGGLSGTAPRDATVEVCWARPDPEGPWVPMLQRLVCWGWHGLNGLPEAGLPAAPANQRFIVPSAAPLSSPPPAAEDTLAAAATVASH